MAVPHTLSGVTALALALAGAAAPAMAAECVTPLFDELCVGERGAFEFKGAEDGQSSDSAWTPAKSAG